MWPIGGSSCNKTLNFKAFGMLPVMRKEGGNVFIGALKTKKETERKPVQS